MTFEQRCRKILRKRTFLAAATVNANILRCKCRRSMGGRARSLSHWSSLTKEDGKRQYVRVDMKDFKLHENPWEGLGSSNDMISCIFKRRTGFCV